MNSSIFDHLYSISDKQKAKKEYLVNEIGENIKKETEKKYASTDSQEIINKIKISVFKRLFNLLNSSGDDIISAFNINLRKLPITILNILEPIIKELKHDEETLNENEFIKACEHLYDMLSFTEKRILIDFNKKISEKKRENNFTFKVILF